MAVQATPPTQAQAGYDAYAEDDERGYGWVMFAGTLLLILGTLNFIEGLAAIGNANFFVNNTHYIAGSLNTWGWVVLCIGVVQWAVGAGVFVKNQFSRWAGVIILALNCGRTVDDDPRLPVLVTVDLHARHPRALRSDRVRQADLQRQPEHAESGSADLGVTECSLVPEDTKTLATTRRVRDRGDAGTDDTTPRQTRQLMEWRRSAQRVTRAWHAWLAAESRDRGERYRAFVAALAEEETAAVEVERIIDLAEARQCTTTIDAAEAGTGRGVRLEPGAHQRLDLDRVDQRGGPRATWPLWARWNDELGQRYTLGVEEELMLLEPRAGSLAQSSDEVLVRLSGKLSAHTSPETHAAVIELATGIHPDVDGVMAELAALRTGLAHELAALGLSVAAAGTHPLTVREETEVSGVERYRALETSLRVLARREPTMALHVHVGVPTPRTRSGCSTVCAATSRCCLRCRPTLRSGRGVTAGSRRLAP